MKLVRWTAVLAAGLSSTAVAAVQHPPDHWIRCDGLVRPTAAAPLVPQLPGIPQASLADNALLAADGAVACTEALADPELTPFWARAVNLLQARAMHDVESGDLSAAVTDLDAARAAAGMHAADPVFVRALGVSGDLLQAAVLLKLGRGAQAEAAAIRAADARPYSQQVQSLALSLLTIDPAISTDEARVWARELRLRPAAVEDRAAIRDWGEDSQAAADDWMSAVAEYDHALGLINPGGDGTRETDLSLHDRRYIDLPYVLARAAFAKARAGHNAVARALLDRLTNLKPYVVDTKARRAERERQEFIAGQARTVGQKVDALRPLVEAYLLANAGQATEAAEKLKRWTDLPVEPPIFDLLLRLKGEPGLPDPKSLRDIAINQRIKTAMSKLDIVNYVGNAPPLESASRPGMFSSRELFWFHDGFGDHPLKDGGRSVGFVGKYSEATVEELTLLRSAQLVRAAQAKVFSITDTRTYRRYVTFQMHGFTQRTPNGFEVQDDIQYGVTGPNTANPDSGLDADAVWNDLSVFYASADAK